MSALSSLNQTFISITSDSRCVGVGSLFLAYPGEKSDGRQYIAQAVANGASAVMVEAESFVWDAALNIPHVAVSRLKEQVSAIAGEFYGEPSQQLWMVGITGTNGKTSCSQWLAQAFNALGKKTAVIGTLGNGFPNAMAATSNTTPDAILLQGMLAEYLADGAQNVVMEVSSHGLQQGRVNGVHFDVAVFTNLTRDHLDYHGSMEAYAAEKAKLFDWPNLKCAVVNVDDAFGQEIAKRLRARGQAMLTYGFAHDADVQAKTLQLDGNGLQMQVQTSQGEVQVKARLIGRFNAYNVLAVLATLLASGVSVVQAVDVIAQIKSAPGRMEQLGGGELPLVVVDYAHTPDALEKVLQTLREQTTGRLFCVFGCGGNRDAGKRPLMGKVAAQLADAVVITSDNPRDESPQAIIADITQGLVGNYAIEPDRAQAIKQVISSATRGDTVLIAGKGHEDCQEIAGVKMPFSDLDQARAALAQYEVAA